VPSYGTIPELPHVAKVSEQMLWNWNFGAFLNHYRKSPQPPECVVVDAAWIEPVSTAKFPANRENNREFCGFWRSAAILTPNRRASSMVSN
jgi:hypothetical protein